MESGRNIMAGPANATTPHAFRRVAPMLGQQYVTKSMSPEKEKQFRGKDMHRNKELKHRKRISKFATRFNVGGPRYHDGYVTRDAGRKA